MKSLKSKDKKTKKKKLKELERKKPLKPNEKIPPKFFGKEKIMRKALKRVKGVRAPFRSSKLIEELEKLSEKEIEEYNKNLKEIWNGRKKKRKKDVEIIFSNEKLSSMKKMINKKEKLIERLEERIEVAEKNKESISTINSLKNDKKGEEMKLAWMKEYIKEKNKK